MCVAVVCGSRGQLGPAREKARCPVELRPRVPSLELVLSERGASSPGRCDGSAASPVGVGAMRPEARLLEKQRAVALLVAAVRAAHDAKKGPIPPRSTSVARLRGRNVIHRCVDGLRFGQDCRVVGIDPTWPPECV